MSYDKNICSLILWPKYLNLAYIYSNIIYFEILIAVGKYRNINVCSILVSEQKVFVIINYVIKDGKGLNVFN